MIVEQVPTHKPDLFRYLESILCHRGFTAETFLFETYPARESVVRSPAHRTFL